MIPKDDLSPDCEFVRGKGFRGLAPLVKFRNGSIIRIKTANQGLGLASATANLVCIDEPVDQSTFNELIARTSRGGAGGKRGTVAISLTPVGGVDVTYIKEMIERGLISSHQSSAHSRGHDSDRSPERIPVITGADRQDHAGLSPIR